MASTIKLPPDWNEFIGYLNARGVRYIVVGAHAVAAAGRPRATQDIDFWVEPTAENARRLVEALDDFGFSELAEQEAEFRRADRMVTLGRPPLRIDIMTSITGVDFQRAWAGRLVVPFGEHQVAFLGRAELLENKRASGRPKDLADLALLTEGEPDSDE